MMRPMALLLGLVAFAGGAWLLVESVEGLIDGLRGWAAAAGLSGVVLAALVLGLDVESTAAGVAATLDDLPGTALGTSIGAAILLLTLGLGLAGIVAPFEVRPPAALAAATAVATLFASALALDGTLERLDGVLLVAVFPPLVLLIVRSRRTGAGPAEPAPRPDRLVGRLVLAFAGLVVGAEILVWGTGRIVGELDLSETVFGLLAVAAAVCFEELVLEMLPAHRGFPELSVGNALGTVVFLLTASLGVIVLVRPIEVPATVLDLHVPVLLGVTTAVLALLTRGRIGRPEGVVLVAAYVAYVAAAIAVG